MTDGISMHVDHTHMVPSKMKPICDKETHVADLQPNIPNNIYNPTYKYMRYLYGARPQCLGVMVLQMYTDELKVEYISRRKMLYVCTNNFPENSHPA